MDVEETNMEEDCDPIHDVIDYLVRKGNVCFKRRQIGEADLSTADKKEIVLNTFKKNKLSFLEKYGDHLKFEHLTYFDKSDEPDVQYHVDRLKTTLNDRAKKFEVKNRRYQALAHMIKNTDHFSETEMMQRNPLLYDQLVDQYLTADEKKARDNIDTNSISLSGVLMEQIIRKNRKEVLENLKSKENESESESEVENIDSDDSDAQERSYWGEFSSQNETPAFKPKKKAVKARTEVVPVTATERDLLKEEFVQEMYRRFLNGEDEDVDYNSIDNNAEYDCIDERGRDEEEKYFDTESPENEQSSVKPDRTEAESDDELDIYMKNLSRHPALRNTHQIMDEN